MPTAPGWRTQNVVVGLAGLLLVSGCSAMTAKEQVFDADGKPVGPLLRSATATSLIVRVRTGKATAALRLRQAGLVAEVLYYESTDCSGTPFLDALSVVAPGHVSTLLASTAIGAPGRTVYVAVPYGWARSIRVGSFSVNETCYFAEPSAKRVMAARPLADLIRHFPPPVRIQSGGPYPDTAPDQGGCRGRHDPAPGLVWWGL